MANKTPNTLQKLAMAKKVTDFFAGHGVQWPPPADPSLVKFRRGAPLRLETLLSLPDETVVYFTYRKEGAEDYRLDEAMRLFKDPANPWSWNLQGGPGSVEDIELDPTTPLNNFCVEYCDGEKQLWEAL